MISYDDFLYIFGFAGPSLIEKCRQYDRQGRHCHDIVLLLQHQLDWISQWCAEASIIGDCWIYRPSSWKRPFQICGSLVQVWSTLADVIVECYINLWGHEERKNYPLLYVNLSVQGVICQAHAWASRAKYTLANLKNKWQGRSRRTYARLSMFPVRLEWERLWYLHKE